MAMVRNVRSNGVFEEYKIGFGGKPTVNLGHAYAFVMSTGLCFVLGTLACGALVSAHYRSKWRAPTVRFAAFELAKAVALLYLVWWYALLSVNCWDTNWTKDVISMHVPKPWRLMSHVVPSRDKAAIEVGVTFSERIGLPIVVKNNGCTTQGIGASVAKSADELRSILSTWKDSEGCIIQEYNTDKHEFGVSYESDPWAGERGIINIAETFRPCHLKKNWSEKQCVGDECGECDRKPEQVRLDLWTAELEKAFVAVADAIPGFHCGRFDVKAKDYESFRKGRFRVVELNGVMGNVLNHAYHGNNMHYMTRRISIGLGNMWHGNAFPPWHMPHIMLNSVVRAARCGVGELIYCPSSSD
eukprot:g1463.t1